MVAKKDLVIKNGKHTDQRMHMLEVAMTFFMECEDPTGEEAWSMVGSSSTPPPMQDEEMMLRIQKDNKVHSFMEGIGLRSLARREVAQALTRVVERRQRVATSEGSLLLVDTGASANILPLPTMDALGIPQEGIIREPLQLPRIGTLH
nr:hypothetical protein CFP56_48507 [Quercus suber]